MQQDPSSEAKNFPANQKYYPYFMKPRGSLPCSHNTRPLSWARAIRSTSSLHLKTYFNIIFAFTHMSSKWYTSFSHPAKILYSSPLNQVIFTLGNYTLKQHYFSNRHADYININNRIKLQNDYEDYLLLTRSCEDCWNCTYFRGKVLPPSSTQSGSRTFLQ